MAFDQKELWETANARITWHEKLDGDEAIQRRVHESVFFPFDTQFLMVFAHR